MLEWLKTNLATILISLLILAAVVFAIVKMVRDKKKGKSSCGCGCANCPMSGQCHKK